MSTSAERMARKRERDADEGHLQRLFDAGYTGVECPPDVTNEECIAWAKGVWARQAEQMPQPSRLDDSKPEKVTKK